MREWRARRAGRWQRAVAGALLACATMVAPGAGAAAGDPPLLTPAPGRLLIAAPSLVDPNFARTVILLLDYDEKGAMGVVVNRRSRVPLRDVLPKVEELATRDDAVFVGGPVGRDRLVVLLRANAAPPTALHIFGDVYASGDLEVLRAAVRDKRQFRAYAGYAGWGPGQLDEEVGRGDWLVAVPDRAGVLDADPTDIWQRLLRRNAGTWVRASDPRLAARGMPPRARDGRSAPG